MRPKCVAAIAPAVLLHFLSPLVVSAQSSTGSVEPFCGPPPMCVEFIPGKAPVRLAPDWLDGSSNPLTRPNPSDRTVAAPTPQPQKRQRSRIGRHLVLFGALTGFGIGFLAGYLPGDDGVFHDFTGEFNGLVLGGLGAGAGAAVGYAIDEGLNHP